MQQVNDGCFSTIGEVPTHALTLTVPALLNSKYILAMVPSKAKAWAIYHTVSDPVSEALPATCLREHEQATLYIDADSASMLSL
jgi:glucosamine-6-phosphate deaminase